MTQCTFHNDEKNELLKSCRNETGKSFLVVRGGSEKRGKEIILGSINYWEEKKYFENNFTKKCLITVPFRIREKF